ncbi:hypothetical protein F3Y22_tig00112614pilonHSYRG00142 [Hibiscus syriacus]|uniref:Uncharacterized protein n=1 Tax=Hibiscus syriacus TaxID=106335 RepID=A0A6A2XU23_HIBSY|nr:hypothetical protein F3Y22_tig00112614pilonHSYRG00142 [Hibiscus syriacus]
MFAVPEAFQGSRRYAPRLYPESQMYSDELALFPRITRLNACRGSESSFSLLIARRPTHLAVSRLSRLLYLGNEEESHGGLWRNREKQGQWRTPWFSFKPASASLPPHSAVRAFPCPKTASPSNVSPHPKSPPSPRRLHATHSFLRIRNISQLLSHIKLLIRRRTAAIAAFDAGLHSEAIRHFSKIVDGRPSPQGFLAECYMHELGLQGRRTHCRVDLRLQQNSCTRSNLHPSPRHQGLTLRNNPKFARLFTRPRTFETAYNTILRDRKLPGPAWKRHYVCYREIPGKLCALTTKIQQLKQRVASGLVRRKRQNPTRLPTSSNDASSPMSETSTRMMATIIEEEAAEKQRKKAAAALQAAQAAIQAQQTQYPGTKQEPETNSSNVSSCKTRVNPVKTKPKQPVPMRMCSKAYFAGIWPLWELLSQVGFNRPLPVKYEALSC